MKIDKTLAQQVFLEFYGIDPKYATFKIFVESLRNTNNSAIIESIVDGINVIIEAVNVDFLKQMGISQNDPDLNQDETNFREMLKEYHDTKAEGLNRKIQKIIFKKLLFAISKNSHNIAHAEDLYSRSISILPEQMDTLLNFFNTPANYSFENELNKLIINNIKYDKSNPDRIDRSQGVHVDAVIKKMQPPKRKGRITAINSDGTLRVSWSQGLGNPRKIEPNVDPEAKDSNGDDMYDIYDSKQAMQTVSMNKQDDNNEGESTEMIHNLPAPEESNDDERITSKLTQAESFIDKSKNIPDVEKKFLKLLLASENIGDTINNELNDIAKKMLDMKLITSKKGIEKKINQITGELDNVSSLYTEIIKIFSEYSVGQIDPSYMPIVLGLKEIEQKQYSDLDKVLHGVIQIDDKYYVPAKSETGRRVATIDPERIGKALFGIDNAYNRLKAFKYAIKNYMDNKKQLETEEA